MTAMITLENAPRDLQSLMGIRPQVLFRLAQQMNLFHGDDDERAFWGAGLEQKAQLIVQGLAQYDGSNGAPPAQPQMPTPALATPAPTAPQYGAPVFPSVQQPQVQFPPMPAAQPTRTPMAPQAMQQPVHPQATPWPQQPMMSAPTAPQTAPARTPQPATAIGTGTDPGLAKAVAMIAHALDAQTQKMEFLTQKMELLLHSQRVLLLTQITMANDLLNLDSEKLASYVKGAQADALETVDKYLGKFSIKK